ncbi:MAG: histidine kinase [candidate division NC10 bacterium]|nr:histidine kinase [candidate division NC10 bacterium]
MLNLPRKTPRHGPPVRSLLVVVLLLSLGLMAVTLLNYRTAVRVAEETLRNQGVSIGLELAAEARARGAWEGPALQQLLAEQRRREVAFLAILDRDGTILAHTNARLVGTQLEDAAFVNVRETGQLTGEMVALGTGEEVYSLTMPFHVPSGGPGTVTGAGQPRFRILRLALHTASARQIVHHALIQVALVGVMVIILLGLSVWQIRTLRRYLRLQEESARQERLAALGGMAAVLAHEIRNPLGAIKGLAQFLGEKHASDATHTEMTQTIATEATRLERLVNDLLTYARPRPPDLQPTDLSAMLHEVMALAKSPAEAAGVKVLIEAKDAPPRVIADPEQMKQLFGNLVLNALQAMPNGGTLTIRVRGGEAGGRASPVDSPLPSLSRKSVEISVGDTGPGIPEADLPRIFEPFYTTRTQGTGLGLAICRQIVEAHGGAIRVSHTGPEGTAIEVTLLQEASADGYGEG